MSARRRLLAVTALAALSACTTVGPNYHVPEAAKINAPEAQGRFLEAASPAVSLAPVPDDWWRLYDDPTLDRLIRQALTANTDLRVAAADLERARAMVDVAKATREATVSAGGLAGYFHPSPQAFLSPFPAANYAFGSAAASVSYDFDVVGRLRRTIEAAKADSAATAAALDLARVSVAADTAGAYLEACSAADEIETANHTIELQRRLLAVTQKLVGAGHSSSMAITEARAALDRALTAVPPLEARRRAALYRLAALLGKPPAEVPPEAATCSHVPQVAGPIPIGDGAALLRRRPDVREAERALAAAVARIGVATAELYPDVSLGAAGGTTGLIQNLGTPKSDYVDLLPTINWTYPNKGVRGHIHAAGAQADAALARFDGVVLNALRETETALAVYGQHLQRDAELRAAREEAAQQVSEVRALEKAGRSPLQTGLAAERSLSEAQAAVAASQGQIAADQVRLFLALGGGWRNAPPVERTPATTP